MANPQKENGYTAISNEIMDQLIKIRIPGEARQILDCVLRKTYGWNKKQDIIALSQYSEMTGLSKPHVCMGLNKLRSMNIITEKGKAITEKGKEIGQVIEFNKDYETWRPLPKKVTLPKKVKSVTEKGKNPLPKKGTTKTSIKTIKTKLPDWLDKKDWDDFKDHRKKLRKPMTQRAEEILIAKLTHLEEQGHNPRHLLITAIERGWQTVYEPK